MKMKPIVLTVSFVLYYLLFLFLTFPLDNRYEQINLSSCALIANKMDLPEHSKLELSSVFITQYKLLQVHRPYCHGF